MHSLVASLRGKYPAQSPRELHSAMNKHAKAVRARDEKLAMAQRSLALAAKYDLAADKELLKHAIAYRAGNSEAADAAVTKANESTARANTARKNAEAFTEQARKMTRELPRLPVHGTRKERRALAKVMRLEGLDTKL
jgi:hypothetical protein